jgi:hypothetical protein
VNTNGSFGVLVAGTALNALKAWDAPFGRHASLAHSLTLLDAVPEQELRSPMSSNLQVVTTLTSIAEKYQSQNFGLLVVYV